MSHVRKPLVAAVALNTVVFVGEAAASAQSGSLSLLADAVHNSSDELGLVCLCAAYFFPLRFSRNLQRAGNTLNLLGIVLISGFGAWQAIRHLLSRCPCWDRSRSPSGWRRRRATGASQPR